VTGCYLLYAPQDKSFGLMLLFRAMPAHLFSLVTLATLRVSNLRMTDLI